MLKIHEKICDPTTYCKGTTFQIHGIGNEIILLFFYYY